MRELADSLGMHSRRHTNVSSMQGSAPREEPSTSVASASETNRGEPRVLFVEDDMSLSLALKTRLDEAGMDVTVVLDGVAARWDLLTKEFDALLLDLGLPGASGLDVLHEGSGQTELPPVIVLTGAEAAECNLARVLGARAVFQKACPSWVLIDAIRSATRP